MTTKTLASGQDAAKVRGTRSTYLVQVTRTEYWAITLKDPKADLATIDLNQWRTDPYGEDLPFEVVMELTGGGIEGGWTLSGLRGFYRAAGGPGYPDDGFDTLRDALSKMRAYAVERDTR